MNARSITVRTLVGDAIAPYVDDLARLRIQVFREWPYLYAGSVAYEAEYLQVYTRSKRSVAVLAFEGGKVVGASTGLPLAEESDAFIRPFVEAGYRPESVFYCGESVLLPAYRGQGLGHRFFDEREGHARALGGFAWTAFCAVDRDPDDPRRPQRHRDNDVFWRKRGYEPVAGMQVALTWPEVGDEGDVGHTLSCWTRPLEVFW